MKASSVIFLIYIVTFLQIGCEHKTGSSPPKMESNFVISDSPSPSKYINTDCEKGFLVHPDIVDSLFKKTFEKKGSIEAYLKIKNFYSFYRKEYLLLSMYMKYSNLYQSAQASFDVYCTMSNFLERNYMYTLDDCTSKKVAFFYLWKCHKEDTTDQYVLKIIQNTFGDNWEEYSKIDFLSYDSCENLPQLITLSKMDN